MSNEGSTRWRRSQRILVAVALGLASVSVAAAVVVGLPRGWALMTRIACGTAFALAAVFLLVNAFWGLTDVVFPDHGLRPAPTALQRVGVFFGSIAAMFSVAVWLVRWQQVPVESAFFGAWGALMLVASTGRPWPLFATVRQRGVVALASSERYARLILASLGLLLIGAALWARVSDACHLTCVGADGATGIRLCSCRHQSSVNMATPAVKALRSST